MARFELTLLGTCAIKLDGKPMHGFASDKARLLLAYLAVEGASPAAPRSAGGNLLARSTLPKPPMPACAAPFPTCAPCSNPIHPTWLLSKLTERPSSSRSRRIAGSMWLPSKRTSLRRNPSCAHSEDLPEAMAHFASATELYRGNFLEGFTLKDCPEFDDWCYFVRERLLHKAATALSQLASYHASRCEYSPAITFARRRIELEPWQEQAHAHLMRLLALDGQQTEALEQFQVCRQRLRDELDVEPSCRNRSAIRKHPLRQVLPSLSPPLLAFNQPPAYLTPLVGREKELGEIATRLHDPACRLLSLTGLGGCGKTRLAVETALRSSDPFPDGTCFVPLVATEDAAALLPAILHALGVSSPSADIRQALFSFLRQKALLLVLDNFEQLLPAGAEVLVELLQAAPQVKLLVTSRERLHLDSEVVYLVEGMRLPAPQQSAKARSYDAVQLFLQTALRQRGSPISEAELLDVVHICRLVSGMPLAIKIAASWTRAPDLRRDRR